MANQSQNKIVEISRISDLYYIPTIHVNGFYASVTNQKLLNNFLMIKLKKLFDCFTDEEPNLKIKRYLTGEPYLEGQSDFMDFNEHGINVIKSLAYLDLSRNCSAVFPFSIEYNELIKSIDKGDHSTFRCREYIISAVYDEFTVNRDPIEMSLISTGASRVDVVPYEKCKPLKLSYEAIKFTL